jgi:hypothetical protein
VRDCAGLKKKAGMAGMTTRTWATLALLAALVAVPSTWAASPGARIRYAEPVVVTGLPAPGQPGTATGAIRTHFEAYGHRFDLELEPNDRVLRPLPSARRKLLPAHALYRGTVAGLPGSWVRLTRLPDGLHGLVYDGTELYVLAPAGSVAASLDAPLAVPPDTTLAFRAADAETGLENASCTVLRRPGSADGSTTSTVAQPTYKAIFAELQQRASAIAATVPTKELDLALVADTQFAGDYGDAQGEMLARLNNVDGIFSSQVGVRIVSGFVQALSSNGGMTSTAPETLLSQFETYRRATPAAASRGLAHLMTGRDLNGATVGIAYLDTVCAAQGAVSLSQGTFSTYTASLIAAHELGHSFGAPHDGENGSACVGTPQVYLMAPAVNGSSTFSQCSLEQIAPVVNSAGCLTPTLYPDVSVETATARVSGYAREVLRVPVEVVSNGTVAADQVTLRITVPFDFTVLDAVVSDGTCSVQWPGLVCQFDSLPVDTRRTVDVGVRSSSVATGTLVATVIASGDADSTNDRADVQLETSAPADGSVTLSTGSVTMYVGETGTFSVTATNSGPLALEDASVEIRTSGGFTMATTPPPGVSCTSSFGMTTCVLGRLPAGESRRIDVGLTTSVAQATSVRVILHSANDYVAANDERSLTINVLPLVELTVEALPGPSVIMLGGTATQSFLLRSAGPQPAENATMDLSIGGGIELVSLTGTGATCGPVNGAPTWYRCTYATPIEPGGTRQIDAVLKGVSGSWGSLRADDRTPASQHVNPARGSVSRQYQLRHDVDLAFQLSNTDFTTHDGRRIVLSFTVDSTGINPAVNARMTVPLPTGVRAVDVETTLGSCSIAADKVTCQFGTFAAGTRAYVRLGIVPDALGTHTTEARLTADGDANAANDATSIRLQVLPNVDLALESVPQVTHVRRDSTIEVPVTVRTATQPVTGASVEFAAYGGGFSIVAAEPAQGSCDTTTNIVRCALGAVSANTPVTIMLRLRGDTASSGELLGITATCAGDIDSLNSHAYATIVVDPRGDVSLRSIAPSTKAALGTTMSVPRLIVSALSPSDDVRVELDVPTSFSVEGVSADGRPCAVNAGHVSCTFGSMQGGMTGAVDLRLRSNQTGTFSLIAQAIAVDDADMTNNAVKIEVTVESGGSNGGSSGGSGGGGGGALDAGWLLLLTLWAPALARRRTSSRCAVRSPCDRRE